MLHNLFNISGCSDEGNTNREEQKKREGEERGGRGDNNLHNKEVNTARQTEKTKAYDLYRQTVKINDALSDTS